MDIKFLTNEYLLAWNILYTKSIKDSFKRAKEKLWNAYKDEYNNTISKDIAQFDNATKNYKKILEYVDSLDFSEKIKNKNFRNLFIAQQRCRKSS